MAGLGSSDGHHVPDELGRDLGPGFDVVNFAVQGATAISSIPSSYAATPQMNAALAMNPDIVLFWFGGNDSFMATWDAHMGEFQADYTSLVRTFQALPSHPKAFLVRLWVFVNTPAQQSVIAQQILPMIDQIAADTGSTLIDYQKAFENHPEYFPDGMHPDDTGTLAIGKFFADSVLAALNSDMADGGADGGPSGDDAANDGDGAHDGASALPAEASAGNKQPPAGPTLGPGDSGGNTAASGNGASGAASGGGASAATDMSTTGGSTEHEGNGATGGGCHIGRSADSGYGPWPIMASLGLLVGRRRRCARLA
jgi:hypothetical protein